jgi:AmiR/NasT family two-component response regulator
MTADAATLTPAQLVALAKLLAERNRQLERALETRIVIEQAKGVLAERLAVDPQEAFEVLRRAARNERRRIHELAAEVVSSRRTPAAVQEAAARRVRQA